LLQLFFQIGSRAFYLWLTLDPVPPTLLLCIAGITSTHYQSGLFVWGGVSLTFCLGWPQTAVLPDLCLQGYWDYRQEPSHPALTMKFLSILYYCYRRWPCSRKKLGNKIWFWKLPSCWNLVEELEEKWEISEQLDTKRKEIQ
jgi:hypothetical protein